jgi:hypothetical protein
MSRPRGLSMKVLSCQEYQRPPDRVHRPVTAGGWTASSRRTFMRVLQPSRSASIWVFHNDGKEVRREPFRTHYTPRDEITCETPR